MFAVSDIRTNSFRYDVQSLPSSLIILKPRPDTRLMTAMPSYRSRADDSARRRTAPHPSSAGQTEPCDRRGGRRRAYGGDVFSFLRRPKWIILGVIVIVMIPSCVALGFWQLGRLQQVRDENARIVSSRAASTDPVGDLMNTTRPPADDAEYRKVTATGVWDAAHQVLVRGRSIGQNNGLFVVTPLITGDGTRLLVARGWIPPGASASAEPAVPAPSPGQVTVAGRIRPPETGSDRSSRVGRYLSVTRLNPAAIGSWTGGSTYVGFIELTDQTPALAADAPKLIPQGALSEGNHESYAYQWFSFAVLAVAAYALMVGLEIRKRRRRGTRSELSRALAGVPDPG